MDATLTRAEMKRITGASGAQSCRISTCQVVVMDGNNNVATYEGYCSGRIVEVNNGGWSPSYELNCFCSTPHSTGTLLNKGGQSHCGNY